MARSENPLTHAFWLGSVDPRPLALFRIGVGLAILHDLADLAGDLRAFLTDDGMLPRGTYRIGTTWSVFDLVSSPLGAGGLLALGAAAVAAFTVGYRTRVATILSWLFVSSLHHRNHFILDGGDAITRALLFWSIFAELGAAYGVDARRRAARVVDVPAFGLRLLQFQIAMLYSATARLKMRAGWLQGDGVFHAMQLTGFTRPPGALLARYPGVCRVATGAVLMMEGAFPVAAFSPFAIRACRAAAVGLALAIQLGILVTMRVGIFTEVMLACIALFLQPAWIDAAETWLRARGWLRDDPRPTSTVELPRWGSALQWAVAAQFLLAIWGVTLGGRAPLPRALASEVRLLDVEVAYGMFGEFIDAPRWRGDGVLADGSPVEVVSVVAPGAAQDHAAWSFDRWYKVTFKVRERRFPFPTLGAYFCRVWDERRPGQPLHSFTLVDDVMPARPPGDEDRTTRPVVLWRETCPR